MTHKGRHRQLIHDDPVIVRCVRCRTRLGVLGSLGGELVQLVPERGSPDRAAMPADLLDAAVAAVRAVIDVDNASLWELTGWDIVKWTRCPDCRAVHGFDGVGGPSLAVAYDDDNDRVLYQRAQDRPPTPNE